MIKRYIKNNTITILIGILSFFLTQTYAEGIDRRKRIDDLEKEINTYQIHSEWIKITLTEIKEDIKEIKKRNNEK